MTMKFYYAIFSYYHIQAVCLAVDRVHLIEDQLNCLRPSLAFSFKSARKK